MLGPSGKAKTLFEQLCGPPGPDTARELRARINEHLAQILRAAEHSEHLPVDLAEELADGLKHLLAELNELPGHHRALVTGAARYFISEEDQLPDTGGVLGLEDDVEVFNYVVRTIGRADLMIEG